MTPSPTSSEGSKQSSPKTGQSPREKARFDPRMSPNRAIPMDAEFVTVEVGLPTEKQKFVIHKSLLLQKAPYFRAALSGSYVEAQLNLVKLPEDSPKAFWYYYQWLYLNKILHDTPDNESEVEEEFQILVPLYILGDRLLDGPFCDAVMDAIISRTNQPFQGYYYFIFFKKATNIIYHNTPLNSPLRRLIVDQHVWHGSDSWYQNYDLKDVDKGFLLDLAIALMRVRAQPKEEAPYQGADSCFYHKHAEGEKCYQTE